MRDALVITDLTRMQEGRVCVAGYTRKGICIRPVLPPPGIHERTLYIQGCAIVFPFAVVEYDFIRPDPRPPHTEDHRYNPDTVKFVYKLDDERKQKILDRTLFDGVSEIFETPILSDIGHYVKNGEGTRSLGTIRPRKISRVQYEKPPEDKWKYRLSITDHKGVEYRLTVTDLAWRYYCDWQRAKGSSPSQITADLKSTLQSSEVYIRIGLARGWEKFPERCFLQITGIYTFPDYLEGHTFADFDSQNLPK
jgi:hypothetical protein